MKKSTILLARRRFSRALGAHAERGWMRSTLLVTGDATSTIRQLARRDRRLLGKRGLRVGILDVPELEPMAAAGSARLALLLGIA